MGMYMGVEGDVYSIIVVDILGCVMVGVYFVYSIYFVYGCCILLVVCGVIVSYVFVCFRMLGVFMIEIDPVYFVGYILFFGNSLKFWKNWGFVFVFCCFWLKNGILLYFL